MGLEHQAFEYQHMANFSVKIEELKKRRTELETALSRLHETTEKERQETRQQIRKKAKEHAILSLEVQNLEDNVTALTEVIGEKEKQLTLAVKNSEVKRDEIRHNEEHDIQTFKAELQKYARMQEFLENWLKKRSFVNQCKAIKKKAEKLTQ